MRKYNNLKYRRLLLTLGASLLVYFILIEILILFESQGNNPQITNFFEGIWYTTVTIAAVGYGDYVPVTPFGMTIGYLFVLASIGLYGYFISNLTNYIAKVSDNKKMGFGGTRFENHTVIIGWDSYAKSVADQLVAVGMKVAVVTTNKENIELIYEHFHHSKQVFVLYSEFDNYDLLRKANIEKANIVFINSDDDTKKLVHLLNFKKEFPHLKFIVTLENSDLKETFKSAGVTYPLSKHDLSSKLLASYIFEPDVAAFGEELLSYASSENDYDIKEYLVIETNPYKGMDFEEAFFDLKKKYNTILIGVSKSIGKGEREIIKNPDYPVDIEKGDYLIMICNGKNEKGIDDCMGIEEGVIH